MRFSSRVFFATACLCVGFSALAATPYAVLDSVQSPAWVDRDGQRLPATPGMTLKNRDRLLTGNESRAIVQLGDGSAVKLGANSQIDFNAMDRKPGGPFTAALDVATGAFRLTTDILRKFRSPRAINVRVGTVTAGIRGTDLWGRSNEDRDLICLLEGRIYVSHPQGEAAELNEPRQFYAAAPGQAPGPVTFVDPEQLREWAQTTELQGSAPTLRRSGLWAVMAGNAGNEEDALAAYDRLTGAGYPVRIRPKKGTEGYDYDLLVGPLVSEHGAAVLARRLSEETGVAASVVKLGQATLRPR